MVAVPILSKLNAFNSVIWYPDKGCHTGPITSRLTDRSFIHSFSSKKYDKKPSLISEEKLDHSSLSDGSHIAVHLDYSERCYGISSRLSSSLCWAHRRSPSTLGRSSGLKNMNHLIATNFSNKRSFIAFHNWALCVRSITAIHFPKSEA